MTRNATTQVSVRLPTELVSSIDATAQAERRTRSAQIEVKLRALPPVDARAKSHKQWQEDLAERESALYEREQRFAAMQVRMAEQLERMARAAAEPSKAIDARGQRSTA